MNLSNFQVSITIAAVVTLLLSIIFNWVTLQRSKNFVPNKRKNEERLSSKYVPPNGQSLNVKDDTPPFDLNNNDDFPAL